MKNFVLGVIVGLIFTSIMSYASEIIVDFSPDSLATLNEELRQIRWKLNNHESRITALEP